jgi:hypothetical protein
MKAEVGKNYTHYKNGNVYTVIAIGRLEENPVEEYVVYSAGYDASAAGNSATWIRLRSVFEEEVTHNGVPMHRFTRTDM